MKLQLEQEKLRFRENEAQREAQCIENEAQRQHELRKLELQGKPVENQSIDITKHIRLVPKFNEEEVGKYFIMFEKVVISLKWEKQVWPILLQSALVGKAQEVYSALPPEQCTDYEVVKSTIIKSYELVPEAYRQKFRNLQKQAGQTFVEFAREKENIFNRWCDSKSVGVDFEALRQLILLEEFKRCIPKEMKMYLEEVKVKVLEVATVIADDYSLTHKSVFHKPAYSKKNGNEENKSFHARNLSLDNKKDPSLQKDNVTGARGDSSTKEEFKVCSYCKKKGHLVSECWKVKRNKENTENGKFVGLTNSRVPKVKYDLKSPAEMATTGKMHEPELENFKGFISEGKVSTLGNPENEKPVVMLRDTGSSQSLMLKDILPFEETQDKASVLIKGISNSYKAVPLQEVSLSSRLKTGPVVVGIVPCLPVKGVIFILGNDIAGDRIEPLPYVSNLPIMREETERLADDIPGIFPSCVLTRSMKKQEDNIALQPTNEVSLGDTFFRDLDAETKQQLEDVPLDKATLIEAQQKDPELKEMLATACSETEMKKVPECFFLSSGVLMRKWRPPDIPANEDWKIFHQVVLPTGYRQVILKYAHDSPIAGHFGINKTLKGYYSISFGQS